MHVRQNWNFNHIHYSLIGTLNRVCVACILVLFELITFLAIEHKQPEKVRFYKLEDGTFLIDIPEMVEVEQNIDVEAIFK